MVNRTIIKTDFGNLPVLIKDFPSPYNHELIHYMAYPISFDGIYIVKDSYDLCLSELTNAVNAYAHFWLNDQLNDIKNVKLNE